MGLPGCRCVLWFPVTERFASNVCFEFYEMNSICTDSFFFLPAFWAVVGWGRGVLFCWPSICAWLLWFSPAGGLGAAGLFRGGV